MLTMEAKHFPEGSMIVEKTKGEWKEVEGAEKA
jgi:hypothetical protein